MIKEQNGNIKNLQDEIDRLKQELDSFKKNEQMFHALVETAVGDIGQDFFNNIVKRLSEWLNAECIIIGQLVSKNIVEGFPMYLDGEIIDGFSYKLKGTPCDLTSKKGYCVYNENVRDVFPNSKDLKDINAQGYVGIALYNKMGEPNGILCAMSRNKLQLPPQAENILRIVGARVTTEIERIKAQKALQASKEKLRIANASKDRLFSIISHDLKNPFNSLIGFSEIIMRNIVEENYENITKYAEVINQLSKETYDLLMNLLEWSLTQTSNIEFNPEIIDLKSLIAELINSQHQQALQKGITIMPLSIIECNVFADENMIKTVLRNLLSNAVKFSSNGDNIEILISVDKENTTVTVSDSGIGIPADQLSKLFDFEHHHSSVGTSNEKGSGLGLILCREFIEKHNGTIYAKSEPGKGSKFIFTLPKI